MSLAVPLTHLTELATAEACLAADLAGRDQAWAAQPSALPGWSRGQVVGHLAGSAFGMINLCEWAASGAEMPMYHSPEVRASEIERRAALPWPALVQDVHAGAAALAARLGDLDEPLGERTVRLGSGATLGAADLAAVRIREIEIHRVDLAAEYQPIDWAMPFTMRTFGQLAPFFRTQREVPAHMLRSVDSGRCWEVGASGPDLLGTEADLLGWLLGRPPGPLRTSDGSPIPVAPAWL
ncbi:MAG: maleylpyruvate isomerase family mycothiol-dependent enzyme [Actinomycetia bacterium]|nr:maleylpyruvate isomerase family mycothiol-dependent enzyme [Actinomycetes bacterium]